MEAQKKNISPLLLLFSLIYPIVFPIALLWFAGDWYWAQGLIWSIWFMILCDGTILYLYFKNPGLLMERYKQPGTGDQKDWDRYAVYCVVLGFIIWLTLIPLDAKRFDWTMVFPLWAEIIGGVGLIFAAYFIFGALRDNSFASPLVRIQKERGQQVISTGVYGFVRHPMYLGGGLLFIGTPLLLGSFYGFLFSLILVFLLSFRIIGEEKSLSEELKGYDDYKKKVRYRLLPFIW